MKSHLHALIICLIAPHLIAEEKIDPVRAANTIVLTESAVKNLKLETVDVSEDTFEQMVFALGRIEAIPARRAAVSSRIPGRITALKVSPGDSVEAGSEVAVLESRQPGDPPPSISLKAPLAGIVTACEIRLGDPADPEKSLLEITDLSEIHAIARVPEHVAGQLSPGTVAHIRVIALSGDPVDGELLRFGTEADRQGGTLDAVFRLANPKIALRPGMRAEFSIVLSRRENVTSVPRISLQGTPSDRFLYVEDFDLPNAFVKSPVQVGEMNDQSVEIISGLLPGDKVVTHGAYSLAFAGGGSISLKEALDAAHGHEHNADGSEMTAAQKAAKEAAERSASGQNQGAGWNFLTSLFAATSGLLLILLVMAIFRPTAGKEPSSLLPS